ncbi:MAG: hypothetical protein [Microviridae sp.]|nr:MAG: hypothetical protein [Microviridae sp.]
MTTTFLPSPLSASKPFSTRRSTAVATPTIPSCSDTKSVGPSTDTTLPKSPASSVQPPPGPSTPGISRNDSLPYQLSIRPSSRKAPRYREFLQWEQQRAVSSLSATSSMTCAGSDPCPCTPSPVSSTTSKRRRPWVQLFLQDVSKAASSRPALSSPPPSLPSELSAGDSLAPREPPKPTKLT